MKAFSSQHGPSAFAVVVLAAGRAAGGQRPPQLAPYVGGSLVEHAARTALASGASEVVVVCGDHIEEIRHRLRRMPVRVVRNPCWAEGLSSSIRVGISSLRTGPEAAVVWLSDQARVSSSHLRELAACVLAGNGPSIAASSYNGIVGVPAAFARDLYPELLALKGPTGARHLIREASVHVETVSFPDASERFQPPTTRELPEFDFLPGVTADSLRSPWSARAPPVASLN